MRRPVGAILICLGAFFLTLAPLVRFYVADQMVRAPLNRYNMTRLEARNATYLDTATLKQKTGATLRAINTVRGDVRANEGNDDIAVWDSSTNIFDTANPDKPVQIQGYRIAFDRRTSQLTNCCGTNVDGDGSVHMSGYGLLFPIANVQKRDYPFFDMSTRRPAPMRYNGAEKIKGITAYRFTQEIPLTKTASLDTKVPARLLGMAATEPDQRVDRYTEAYNSVWVDPRTGIPVKHRQNIRSTVQTPDGRGKMIVAQAELITIDEDQKKLVDMSNGTALQINLVRSFIPLGGVLIGLLLLVIGSMIGLRAAPAAPPAPPAPRRSDGKFGDVPPVEPEPAAPPAREGSRPPAPKQAQKPGPNRPRRIGDPKGRPQGTGRGR
ncbi:DUF3068 domain-containing protein [Spirillospora albida]|uniref:DUF3068 domain-containing protein n=1 Tax=Spirillospora albida TaxID=58123 RepID=UPI00068D92D1|nr:DUF3068 domain-containing protein [Spirillospora albida]